MTDTKVSLSILVPGATMFSKQLCFKNSKNEHGISVETPVEGMTDHHRLRVEHEDKKTHKKFTKVYEFHTRKSAPAKQVMNICKEAYDHMTSESRPDWFRVQGENPVSVWSKMSKEQRLQLQLNRLAESLGGVVDSYEVFPDDEDMED